MEDKNINGIEIIEKEEEITMKIVKQEIIVDKLPKNCNKCLFNVKNFEGRPYCSRIGTTKENPHRNSLVYWEYTGPDARKRNPHCPLKEES